MSTTQSANTGVTIYSQVAPPYRHLPVNFNLLLKQQITYNFKYVTLTPTIMVTLCYRDQEIRHARTRKGFWHTIYCLVANLVGEMFDQINLMSHVTVICQTKTFQLITYISSILAHVSSSTG